MLLSAVLDLVRGSIDTTRPRVESRGLPSLAPPRCVGEIYLLPLTLYTHGRAPRRESTGVLPVRCSPCRPCTVRPSLAGDFFFTRCLPRRPLMKKRSVRPFRAGNVAPAAAAPRGRAGTLASRTPAAAEDLGAWTRVFGAAVAAAVRPRPSVEALPAKDVAARARGRLAARREAQRAERSRAPASRLGGGGGRRRGSSPLLVRLSCACGRPR